VSRVVILDGDKEIDVFELVELTEDVARVRSAFLFEVGEELALRVDRGGVRLEGRGRVRAHTGQGKDRVTELDLGGVI
jgi:hypothetical protein